MWWTLIFSLITLIFYPIIYTSFKLRGKSNMGIALFGTYFLCIFILAFVMVSSLIKTKCNSISSKFGSILKIISITWLLIFVVLWLIITFAFPEWKAPFSNTFGYGIAHMYNIKEVVSNIKNHEFDINSITSENFEEMCKTYNILNTNADIKQTSSSSPNSPPGSIDVYSTLKKIVYVKESTSLFIWFILTGYFIILITQNYISGQTCDRTVEESVKLHEDYEKKIASGEHKRSSDPDSKDSSENAVYTI